MAADAGADPAADGASAAVSPPPTAAPAGASPLDAEAARALLADALYLESGMGDYGGAGALYEQVLGSAESLPEALSAEACLRLGLAHEKLGKADAAEAVYQRILQDFSSTTWAADARSRLQSLEEDRKVVRTLPVAFGFDEDVGALFHARSRSNKGRVEHEVLLETDGDAGRGGVVAWSTYVIGGEDDILFVGFAPDVMLEGQIELDVRTANFPAHLSFFLIDGDGSRYGSTARVVRPEQGWKRLELRASDFQDRGVPAGRSVYSQRQNMRYLAIQDVTGHSATDRGENVIMIDELSLR